MIDRRAMLAGLAASATVASARAQSDRQAYPDLVFAHTPGKNASGVTDRWEPPTAYLSRQLGTRVTLRIANDDAAVIEGQRAGNIHIASYGPASFARALLTGVKTTAFAINVNGDGTKGYHSVFYVKADGPYRTIADLKGKVLGLVDPNAEHYFSDVLITVSHENAVLALWIGTTQTSANGWNAPDDSNLTGMLNKGMVERVDGSPASVSDSRIILTSDLKAAIRTAFLDAAKNDKAAFDRLTDGKNRPWQPIDNAANDDTIKLITFATGCASRTADGARR